jgi:hypothetical protein
MISRGILDQVIRKGVDTPLTLPVRFTKERITEAAGRAAERFRDSALNLLSSFEPLEGEYGVWQTMDNFIQAKNPLGSEIEQAIKNGDEGDLVKALTRAIEYSFAELYNRGALARLQLVDPLSPEAMNEWIRLSRSVAPATPRLIPVAQEAPVAPVAVETPTEVCAREWKELSGDQFKTKYLNNRNNRPIYEQCLVEGKI